MLLALSLSLPILDVQALSSTKAETLSSLVQNQHGLGAGGQPEAVMLLEEKVKKHDRSSLSGDMVFITAGMGWEVPGTGATWLLLVLRKVGELDCCSNCPFGL